MLDEKKIIKVKYKDKELELKADFRAFKKLNKLTGNAFLAVNQFSLDADNRLELLPTFIQAMTDEDLTLKEIEEEKTKQEKLIAEKVNYELDLIGIASHLQGRKYLFDAITYLLSEEGENSQVSINQYLLSKHKRPTSTINRAMQNVITRAWRVNSIEDLERYYTAHINYNTGVPTPVEFIYYYVGKIKKEI